MIYIKYHTTKEMIVDIIIIAIMALSIFLGYKKGLVKLGIGLCAGIIAIAISLILYRPITNIVINTTNIDENIEQQIIEKSKTNEIAEQIGNRIKRGSTSLYGKGMYKKQDRKVLFCVASRNEVREIRKIVKDIDSNAFVVITNAREVFGEGFKET